MESPTRSKTSRLARPLACAAALVALAAAAPTAKPPLAIIPLSEVRAGMKGYGLTVASGDKVERFGVEVVGVVPNATPGRSSIIVKLSGLGLEESGIVAGMSGSPVYLDGRLAGAVATGWGFTKGPIGGVTPIEQMLAISGSGERSAATGAGGASVRAADVLHALALPEEARLPRLQELSRALRLDPPAEGTPLLAPLAAGFPADVLERARPLLAGLLPAGAPVSGSEAPEAPPAAPPKMEGGSAITALLVEGDLQLGATGTVTAVLPDGTFLAFGHPFLGLGELALPVAPAEVVSFLPNFYQSFKIAWSGRPAWRLVKDRDSGVSGALDGPAPMVPVTVRVEAPGVDRTFRFRVAPHPRLLPALLALTTDAALTIADPTPRDRTMAFRIAYETAAGEIAYQDVASGNRAKDLAVLTTTVLGGALLDNELADPKISAVNLSFRSRPGERRLRLVSAALAATKVRPGDSLVATVRLADRRGAEEVRTVRIAVPKQMPEGRASLLVADGATGSATRLLVNPAEPRTLAELKRLMDTLVPTDRMLAAILVGGRASATGSATLTSLPPTAAALLSEPVQGGESLRADVAARLAAEEIVPFDRPVAGSAHLEFEVERRRF